MRGECRRRRALEHPLRQVEAGDKSIAIRPTKQEAGVTAIAAARIENGLAATDIEGVWTDEPAGERFVSGNQTRKAGELAGDAVVLSLNEIAVIPKGLPAHFL